METNNKFSKFIAKLEQKKLDGNQESMILMRTAESELWAGSNHRKCSNGGSSCTGSINDVRCENTGGNCGSSQNGRKCTNSVIR